MGFAEVDIRRQLGALGLEVGQLALEVFQAAHHAQLIFLVQGGFFVLRFLPGGIG